MDARPGKILRVLQEDWVPFHNLPNAARRFTEQTGIPVEVKLSSIPEFWALIERSFKEDNPPFDLVGCDELLLMQYAQAGDAQPLDEYVARDGYSLEDFEHSALATVTLDEELFGLPYCNVSSVLIYRHDLFDRYAIPVPQTMDELSEAAAAVQYAVRRDSGSAGAADDFSGITLRGAPSCGLNFWVLGSNWLPAWGVEWFDGYGNAAFDSPEHLAALEHYLDLLRLSGPPRSWTMGFKECMATYRGGRAAMVIEPANEASILYDDGGFVADATMTTLVPAGPLGTRHPGLYNPPYAIPARSKMKDAAWELAKFLCSPAQVLQDAESSGLVEVARRSMFNDPRFTGRFRQDLVETALSSRPLARGERPISRSSFQMGDILGDEYARALRRTQTARESIQNAQGRVTSMLS